MSEKLSIEELEKLLQKDDEIELELLPNGMIIAKQRGRSASEKVLTMRENLGGEYAK